MFRFCWHNWTKWSEPESIKCIRLDRLTGDKTDCYKLHQVRRCQKCNQYQERLS